MIHFLDVGAGRGEIFTLDDPEVMTPKMRRHTVLHCFEPSPRNFVHLVEAARQHAHEWADVFLHCMAVGATKGTCRLWLKTDHSGDSLREDWQHNEAGQPAISVLRVAIRDVLSGIVNPDCRLKPWESVFLKLDCEGAETEILHAIAEDQTARSAISVAWVEWHDADPAARNWLEEKLQLRPWNH